MSPFTHAPKPNTRIPPILIARQNKEQETATGLQCTKLADLSKQKLWKEASTGDPDLRRCLGHHRLLRRSIQEAQEDMKRYLGEVVEYEDETDDEDEIDVEEYAVEAETMEDEVVDEEEELFDGSPKIQEREFVFLGPRGRAREVYIPKEKEKEISKERGRSTCVKERFVDAVRGLMRRHTSPLPLPLHLRAVAAGKKDAPLRQTLQKNNSCSNIPIYIHVHEHDGKEDTFATGLEKTPTGEMRTCSTESLGRRARGRRYVERLGIRTR
ncbi:hypothetical protein BJY00DRAFT_110388 [Aspergillus carlsbadensis]|nr:hypothetical protein BJY00DRAFT_110388 [Aspergillus carlsbadensis]